MGQPQTTAALVSLLYKIPSLYFIQPQLKGILSCLPICLSTCVEGCAYMILNTFDGITYNYGGSVPYISVSHCYNYSYNFNPSGNNGTTPSPLVLVGCISPSLILLAIIGVLGISLCGCITFKRKSLCKECGQLTNIQFQNDNTTIHTQVKG